RPRPPFLVEERPHQHLSDIGVDAVRRARRTPVHVQRGDGLLREVVGAVRVAAQQVAQPAQGRQPGRDVLDVLLLPGLHRRLLSRLGRAGAGDRLYTSLRESCATGGYARPLPAPMLRECGFCWSRTTSGWPVPWRRRYAAGATTCCARRPPRRRSPPRPSTSS